MLATLFSGNEKCNITLQPPFAISFAGAVFGFAKT
jgi:hypothetical protein